MSDELRERVARAIGEAYYRDATHGKYGLHEMGVAEEWLPEADAAIAIVRKETMEEAARVADEENGHREDTGSPPTDFTNSGKNYAAQCIAAAIRALGEK